VFSDKFLGRNNLLSYLQITHFNVEGTVQQKLTWVKSGINRKLMISFIVARYFFKIVYGFYTFKFKETVFGVLQNFGMAFLDRVARAD
jgi:hypothetical protein